MKAQHLYKATGDKPKMRVLVDSDVVMELFINRSSFVEDAQDLLLSLADPEPVEVYVTDKCLRKIRLELGIKNKELGEQAASGVETMFNGRIINIDSDLKEQARKSPLRDFESAEEVACAIAMDFDAIITQNPSNFDGVNFPFWSIAEFLERIQLEKSLEKQYQHGKPFFQGSFARYTQLFMYDLFDEIDLLEHFKIYLHLDKCLHYPLVVDWVESQSLPSLDTPSLHTLEVVGIMKYNVRNSINTVMEFFQILQKEGYQGISYQKLQKKYNYSESKITNIIWDLQKFRMATTKSGRVNIEQSLIDSDNITIANYLAKFIRQHIVVKKIYNRVKPNEYLNRAYLKRLVREIDPNNQYKTKNIFCKQNKSTVYSLPLLFGEYAEENSIATKSAGNYISRMLGWLLFTGLLEQKNEEVFLIPIKEGKQKGKLLEENVIPQLDTSLKQLELFHDGYL